MKKCGLWLLPFLLLMFCGTDSAMAFQKALFHTKSNAAASSPTTKPGNKDKDKKDDKKSPFDDILSLFTANLHINMFSNISTKTEYVKKYKTTTDAKGNEVKQVYFVKKEYSHADLENYEFSVTLGLGLSLWSSKDEKFVFGLDFPVGLSLGSIPGIEFGVGLNFMFVPKPKKKGERTAHVGVAIGVMLRSRDQLSLASESSISDSEDKPTLLSSETELTFTQRPHLQWYFSIVVGL